MANKLFDIAGRRVLLVGGDSGIGLACAEAFARAGARLVIAGVSQSDGDDRAARIAQETGSDVSYVEVDVRDEARVAAMVETAVQRLGGLDIAMNNAGIPGPSAAIQDYDTDAFDNLFSINVRGTFLSMKYEIPHLLESGKGSIINLASTAAITGLAMVGPYAGTKHAVAGLTKSAALELAAQNVRVNAIAPGPVQTNLLSTMRSNRQKTGFVGTTSVPMDRVSEPEEMAGAVLWLASDASSFVTGAIVSVDGGVVAQ